MGNLAYTLYGFQGVLVDLLATPVGGKDRPVGDYASASVASAADEGALGKGVRWQLCGMA